MEIERARAACVRTKEKEIPADKQANRQTNNNKGQCCYVIIYFHNCSWCFVFDIVLLQRVWRF